MPKSMAAIKSFRPRLSQDSQIQHWLDILSSELFTRLFDDFDLNKRWPKTLVLGVTVAGNHRSRSCPMLNRETVQSPCQLSQRAWNLYKLDAIPLDPSHLLSNLSLSVTGLEKVEQDQGRLAKWLIKKGQGDRCEKCGQLIGPEERDQVEHDDWHLALDLSRGSAQENVFNNRSQPTQKDANGPHKSRTRLKSDAKTRRVTDFFGFQ